MKLRKRITAVITAAVMAVLMLTPAVPPVTVLQVQPWEVSAEAGPMEQIEKAIMLVNERRTAAGVPKLYTAPCILNAAQARADEMSPTNQTGIDSGRALSFFNSYGIKANYWYETYTWDSALNPTSYVNYVMQNPDNAEWILSTSAHSIGIGLNVYKSGSKTIYYWILHVVGDQNLPNSYIVGAEETETTTETTEATTTTTEITTTTTETTTQETTTTETTTTTTETTTETTATTETDPPEPETTTTSTETTTATTETTTTSTTETQPSTVQAEIRVEKLPDKTEYPLNSWIDLTGGVVYVRTKDNRELHLDMKDYQLRQDYSGFRNYEVGEYTITLYYTDNGEELSVSFPVRVIDPNAAKELLLGDVTADGSINAKDATLILVTASKIGTGEDINSLMTEAERKAADVNRDGKINAKDATFVLQYAAYIGTGGTLTLEQYIDGNR